MDRRQRNRCLENCDRRQSHCHHAQEAGHLAEALDKEPDIEVLSEAPTPETVPTTPWAKLNPPVPFVRSAMTSAVSTPSEAPVRPSSTWMTTSTAGSSVNAKNPTRIGTTASPMRRSGRRPQVSAVRPAHGASSTTMICGGTISPETVSEDQRRSTCTKVSLISGKIEAFATWNRKRQTAKVTRRPSLRRSARLALGGPVPWWSRTPQDRL